MSPLWRTVETETQVTVTECDGCRQTWPHGDLAFVTDYGHECRYCRDCAAIYAQWVVTTRVEEGRRQREFDAWQTHQRAQVPLRRMPMDFPPAPPRVPTTAMRLA